MKTKKMNNQVKKLWVAALRSGKYKQGTGQLHRNNMYCCLGVLEDLYLKHELPRVVAGLKWGTDPNELYVPGTKEEYTLNPPVMKWAGLKLENPEVPICKIGVELSQLNDEGVPDTEHKRLNFKQIAGLIEKHL